jgi:DNA-binding NtrC family response regulator
MCEAGGCHDAKEFLKHNCVAVVICECILPDGNWGRLLKDLSLLPSPPLLIVTSNLADDALWVEALNLGAYDVLAKPFEMGEVTRIISLAWLHWKEQRSQAARKPVQQVSASKAKEAYAAST